MASLLRSLLGPSASGSGVRANETTPISITDWGRMFRPGQQVNYGGRMQQAYQLDTTAANGAVYGSNAVVFACELRRLNVFSEARWQFQQMRSGRAGDLFGNPSLSVFENPWPGASTRDLLIRAELDVATHGNSYWIDDPNPENPRPYLLRLEPLNVSVLTEAIYDPVSGQRVGEQLLGYLYQSDGDKKKLTHYLPEQVAHYAPIPDPDRQFMGMSWMNPCLPDVDADQTMTSHKLQALKRGGNLGYVVTTDANMDIEMFREFVDEYKRDHEGPENVGKTLFLGGGSDIKTVGQSFVDLALKATQGAGESRIAACSGVPPVVVGLSEGMQGSSLNAGNYGAAKRNFVDGTVRPMWGAFAGAFQTLVPPPIGSRLWYDDRDIPFLREDVTAQADIMTKDAMTVRQLLDGGYEPDAAVEAVAAGDIKRLLGRHTGFLSVQLQDPTAAAAAAEAASAPVSAESDDEPAPPTTTAGSETP